MAVVRRRVVISGRVQGVAFRHYTRITAEEAGVNGWVKNLPDGRVEAVFEGSREQVDDVISWCRQGPPASKVDHVEIIEEQPKGERQGFTITF
jgi:acylphosphatase